MSLGLFCFPVHADTVDSNNIKVNYHFSGNGFPTAQVDILNGASGIAYNVNTITIENKIYYMQHRLTFVDTTGATLFQKGKTYTLRAENLWFTYSLTIPTDMRNITFNPASGNSYSSSVQLVNVNGERISSDNAELYFVANPTTGGYTIEMKLTPEEDVYKVVFYVGTKFNPVSYLSGSTGLSANSEIFIGTTDDSNMLLNVSLQSEEAGLLAGLIGWVTNIFNKITDGFDAMVDGFANIGTWFAELPGKLWSLIEDGLKSLFVPDDEYMISYSDNWDQLLSERLGAVYEVANIVSDSWDGIMNADQTNTVSIPVVSIPLPGGNNFQFGGYDVKIVPDGFSVLVTALKLIVGIVCTFGFVNGLLKRYDEVMGVET